MLQKLILVVEDDPVSAKVLTDFLGVHGYRTMVARTGADGLSWFRLERPDLMLVDVMLPHKNGFEFAFEVKKEPGGRETPLLFMSAVYKDEHAQEHARNLDADGYLLKPFDFDDLLSQVRSLLGEQ